MADKPSDIIKDLNESLSSASSAIDKLNKSALEGGDGIRDVLNVMNAMIDVADEVSDSLTGIVGKIPILGALAAPFEYASNGLEEVGKSALQVLRIFDELGRGLDSTTSFSRELDSAMFGLSSKFAGTFEEAKKFGSYIIDSAEDFAKAEQGFISPSERIGAARALSEAGIPIQKMGESIQFAGGELDILNVSILQSKALGMSVEQYSQKISDAMMTQGLSTQQAVEQMTMFGDISKEVGLPVESIAGNLSSLADRFSLLGIKADFGRPILEGFGKTLRGLGLGTKNALDLTSTFSDALVKLTSDYAAAYITFQRGGLDIGKGGVLGASIGLRAQALEAEKTGTQGDLAIDLANSMKETLESFTGGQVVTVTEAAASPELQQTFYTQTQLLKDLYGIQDTGAQDRTLELLQQLDEATRSGDTDLQASLASQLEESKTSRDSTMGYQEKTAAGVEATVAQLTMLNSTTVEVAKVNASLLSSMAVGSNELVMKTAMDGLSKIQNIDPSEAFKQINDYYKEKGAEAETGSKYQEMESAMDTVIGGITEVKDTILAGKIDGLTAQMGQLVEQLKILTNNRTSSALIGG